MKPSLPVFALSLGVFAYGAFASQTEAAKKADINFGRDVRPILSEHCFKCHGPDVATAAAGLRLDSFAGATKTLGDGAAIVAGNPSASKLLERVSAKDPADRMPPEASGLASLTPAQIETLRTWIASGARYEKHWAFVAPVMPKTPTVRDEKWCRNPIDRFVLAKLESSGLKPEPEADKDTLALRAAQTLTGLPPIPQELEKFRADKAPGAYERYVDRLIAKPAYGEHQARYWMDAVRYADTHGLQLDNERRVYPYRDWVVHAFNEDLPFDKFVLWQLAGDLLSNPTTEQLVATGYVRMNLTSNEGGAIEDEFLARNTFDRVDTTSTVMLGLTVGCAKCHDHKYDPIKQRDYYGLYAYFDSTQDKPLDGNIALPPPFVRAATKEEDLRVAEMAARLEQCRHEVDPARAAALLEKEHEPLPSTRDWQISPIYGFDTFDKAFDTPEPPEPGGGDVQWKPLKFKVGQDNLNLIGRDTASVYVKGTLNSPTARTLALRVSSDDGIRIWLNGKLIHSHKVNRGMDEIDFVTANFQAGDNELIAKLINGGSSDGLNIRLGYADDQEIDEALVAYHAAPQDAKAQEKLQTAFLEVGPSTEAALAYRKLLKEKAAFETSIPMTLIAREMEKPRPTYILKRGQYDQPGDKVERHLPAVLGELPPGAPNNRLGLAKWLISPSNPLVSRVFVNRIWQQHFGCGIVKTVEDFGSQGEWPQNQPLLDYLAVNFEKDGWSLKRLNRLIVTSAAFRQSSRISKAKLAKDPDNRLISRGPRFRLDAEVIRDKALDCAGLLSPQIGGRGFKPYQPEGLWEGASDPASETHFYVREHGSTIYRRSMYLFWKRTSPPPAMITLDAPLRDTCVVRRSLTNTPLQALTLLNETAFLEASRTMAVRVLRAGSSDESRLRAAYDLAMGRAPDQKEAQVLLRAVARYRHIYASDIPAAEKLLKVGDTPEPKSASPADEAAWMIVCSTLMNTSEFLTLH